MPPNDELVFFLAPVGTAPEWVLQYVGKLVIENFGARAGRLRERSLPQIAYRPEKDAYDAGYLLDDLKFDAHISNANIVGITAVKIYDQTDGPDGSILDGLALLGGPALIISLPPGSDEPTDRVKTIVRNVLLHELGHFFGLTDRNCEKNCLMNDKAKSTAANLKYCAACQKRIRKILNGKAWQP